MCRVTKVCGKGRGLDVPCGNSWGGCTVQLRWPCHRSVDPILSFSPASAWLLVSGFSGVSLHLSLCLLFLSISSSLFVSTSLSLFLSFLSPVCLSPFPPVGQQSY